MRKHYDDHDVTYIFQEKRDYVAMLKDYLGCLALTAAIAVPFVIYLW